VRRSRRRALSPRQLEQREERMRPSRFIGYEHDALGVHLVRIGSFDLAESELRRAVWLNPFERRFAKHLAWCLYRKGEYAEAREWALRALTESGGDDECRELLRQITASAGLAAPESSI